MLKVVCVVDKVGTALDRLAKGVIPYHDNLDYTVCDVHPKRPDESQLKAFLAVAQDADIIDFQYFKTALKLLELFPWLKTKELLLTHNNPYSIYDDRWEDFDMLVGNNNEITANLKEYTKRDVKHVPITTDPLFWEFKREFEPNRNVIMVANRIEGKKGVLPVAIACGDAGLRLTLVGAVSDRQYLYDIMQTGVVDFYEQISDEELRKLYHNSTIHVCNSVDNFESGTMPILESMQCGVPVLTRLVGHVPDLYNDENLTIYKGDNEDNLAIQSHLETMINDSKALDKQRQSAWNTAKNFNFERRAYEYQKLYRELMSDQTPVSVVVPISDNPDTIRACLNAIAGQTYSNLEVLVCDDSETTYFSLVAELAKTFPFPVRYLDTAERVHKDYGLARARNAGIIEATGEIMVFCDQRQIMEPDAIEKMVANVIPRTWVFGNKNGKKDFVENFSAIRREDIIRAGMFCERIDAYGGMSQEVRSRTRMQGIKHVYIEDAKAVPLGKSSNKNTKRADIIRMKNRLAKMGL